MHVSSPPLTLLHAFPSFKVGGAQIRFATIANHFGASFRHLLFAMDSEYECRERLDPALAVNILNASVHKNDTLGNWRRFRSVLKATRPDVLVTYNWGAIEWGIANWPLVARHIHIEDGFGPEEADRQLMRRVWTRRLVLRRTTVVLPSRKLLRLASSTWRLRPQTLRYIPNGIDCAHFSRMSASNADGAGKTLRIGTVSALRQEKNQARLIYAFKIVSKHIACQLIIVGDGPERQRLEALVADLGLTKKVLFEGHVVDPARVYHSIDVFVLSSDTEQMPYTIMEAMAAGLPIAATDVGDISNMVAPANLRYIVPPDVSALAKALLELLQSAALRREIGASNQTRARDEFDLTRMLSAYGALFRGDKPINLQQAAVCERS